MAKVELNLKALDKLRKALKGKEPSVVIGIQEGISYRQGSSTIPVSEVAAFLEYGWTQSVTGKQSAWLRSQGVNVPPGATLTSPPRPFFEATYRAQKERWKQLGRARLKGIASATNPMTVVVEALRVVGTAAQQDLQDAVQDGGVGGTAFAPRSPLTMLLYEQAAQSHRRDGSPNQTDTTKPLYRTGTLAAAIAYELRGIK